MRLTGQESATTGSTRPTAVGRRYRMPTAKRPFAACGKLTSILDESAETQGVHNYDGTRRSRFYRTFRPNSKWLCCHWWAPPVISPELINVIAQRSETRFRPASSEAIVQLQTLGLSGDVVDFYRRYEPAECAEIDDVRLWPISEVVAENRSYVPGANLVGHGFVVFATTVFGDAYCFDISEDGPPIVLMSHEVNYEDMSVAKIKALRKLIASNLDAFLDAFAAGSLDMAPKEEQG